MVKTDEEIEFEKLLEKNKIVHYIDEIQIKQGKKEKDKKKQMELETSD